MEERMGDAFAGTEQLTVIGRRLCPGGTAPDFCLNYLDLVQARWQDRTGVLHQALSAHHSVQFGQDYGMWLREWHLLQRSVVVIDRADRIVYVEYVPDQMSEPDYTAALQAVQQAAEP